MSRLNFASINEAYNIGSQQIKSRQDEIDKLKKIIEGSSSSSTLQNVESNGTTLNTTKNTTTKNIPPTQNNSIVPNSSKLVSPEVSPDTDNFEYSFYKLSNNPKFDQIIKNYIIINHPEWLMNNNTPTMNTPTTNTPTMNTPTPNFSNTVSRFGTTHKKNSNIQNYVIFFIISIVIYLLLILIFKK